MRLDTDGRICSVSVWVYIVWQEIVFPFQHSHFPAKEVSHKVVRFSAHKCFNTLPYLLKEKELINNH